MRAFVGCKPSLGRNTDYHSPTRPIEPMVFPQKFRPLLELTDAQVERPDHVWLAYAVCATEADSCGWGGWMIEAAVGASAEDATRGSFVSAADEQRCPRCGRPTFRTGVSLRLEPSVNQGPPLREGVSYEAVPLTYDAVEFDEDVTIDAPSFERAVTLRDAYRIMEHFVAAHLARGDVGTGPFYDYLSVATDRRSLDPSALVEYLASARTVLDGHPGAPRATLDAPAT